MTFPLTHFSSFFFYYIYNYSTQVICYNYNNYIKKSFHASFIDAAVLACLWCPLRLDAASNLVRLTGRRLCLLFKQCLDTHTPHTPTHRHPPHALSFLSSVSTITPPAYTTYGRTPCWYYCGAKPCKSTLYNNYQAFLF